MCIPYYLNSKLPFPMAAKEQTKAFLKCVCVAGGGMGWVGVGVGVQKQSNYLECPRPGV